MNGLSAREPRPGAAEPRRSIAPLVVSLLVAGALILVMGYWVGKRQAAGAAVDSPPGNLTLLEPRDGAVVDGDALVLVFRTDAPLELTPRGWLAGAWHVHAMVDDVARMAGASDLRASGAGHFAWTLVLPPGEHTLALRWATLEHRVVTRGGSARIRVRVRGAARAGSGA